MKTLPSLPDSDSEDFRAGDPIGPYRLVAPLGRGGMGEVWSAWRIDGALERTVALKLPSAGMFTAGARQRLMRERDILASLTHPGIAQLHDAGVSSEGQPYLALELVEGRRIDEFCRHARLDVPARVVLFGQVLEAIQYAHGRLIVHRDLKPSNILVTDEGRVKLLDFGIAKLMDPQGAAVSELTRLAGVAMTPEYASPEQFAQEPVGVASDVFSLGVVLYELLTGQRPFERQQRSEAAPLASTRIAETHPAESLESDVRTLRRALSGDLDAILAKCLSLQPGDRYASAEQLADDLVRYRLHQPIRARRIGRLERIGKFARRNRVSVALGAGLGLALLAGVAGIVWQARLAVRAQEKAEISRERAQALVTFMLGDLRERMTAAGSLDALASTVGQVEAYLASSDNPANTKERTSRADVFVAMSEIAYNRGKLADAVDAGRKAVGISRTLPLDDPNRDYRLGRSLMSLANPLLAGDGCQEAIPLLGEARALLEPAHQRAPGNPAIARALADSYSGSSFQLSTLGCGEPDIARGLHYTDQCASLMKNAAAGFQSGEAGPYVNMQVQCEINAAVSAYQFDGDAQRFIVLLAEAERLSAEYERDFSVQFILAAGMSMATIVFSRKGDFERAQQANRLALELTRRTTDQDPGNAERQLQRALALRGAVELELSTRRWKEALPLADQALAVMERGIANDPVQCRWRLEAMNMRIFRVTAMFRMGASTTEMLDQLERGLQVPIHPGDNEQCRSGRPSLLGLEWILLPRTKRSQLAARMETELSQWSSDSQDPSLRMASALVADDAAGIGRALKGIETTEPYYASIVRDHFCAEWPPSERLACRGL